MENENEIKKPRIETDCACGGTGVVPSIDPDEEDGYEPCPDCLELFPHSLGAQVSAGGGERRCSHCGETDPVILTGVCPADEHPNRVAIRNTQVG